MITTHRVRGVAALLALLVGSAAVGQAQDQTAVITGQVSSAAGQPLASANVFIAEMTISVATNAQGRYTITVPAARVSGQAIVLRARAVGYKPGVQQLRLTAGTQTVNFTLEKDIQQLEAVVTTGTAVATEQIKVPFAVTIVDSATMPVQGSNAISQLQGKVPGAMIVQATGRPGAAPSVVLRGPVSLNATGRSQSPLYIVDGIPIQGDLPDMNPADIQNMEILKGAAAAALYGARAGAGVISITTKTGAAGQGIKISARTEYGAGDIERQFPLARHTTLAMDPTGKYFCTREKVGGSPCARYIDWDKEVDRINNSGQDYSLPPQLFLRDFGIASAPSYDDLTGDYQVNTWMRMSDPVSQLVTSSPYSNSNIDLNGRVGNTGIYASIGNSTQEGAVKFLSGYRRNSLRLNANQHWGDKLQLDVTSFFAQTRQDGANMDETGSGGAWFNITRAPWMSQLDERDALGRIIVRHNPLSQGDQNYNPAYAVAYNTRVDRGTRFIGGSALHYTPLSWLKMDGTFGYDRQTSSLMQMRDKGWRTTSSNPGSASGYLENDAYDNEMTTVSLNASATHTFFGDLNATLSSRYTYSDQVQRNQGGWGNGLVVGGLGTADAVTTNYGITSGVQDIRDAGYYIAGDFDYKDRYTLSLLGRRDGSSLFGPGNRWQGFGRVAGSWIVSREPWWFMPNAVDLLKLRASRGSTGQRPRFSAQYETFTIGTGGQLNPSTLGNKNLKPEINTETELGADLEFFNRIGLNVTHAQAVIDGQILPVRPPTSSGFQLQWQNAGQITNKTWELTLSAPVVANGAFTWTSRVIYDRTRSQITRLDVPEFVGTITAANSFDIFKYRQGEMIGTMYGFDYVKSCGQLPANFQSQCSMNKGDLNAAYRPNADGYIVWLGAGNKDSEGITKNLWRARTGLGNGPWGNNTNWGMPISLRDSTGAIAFVPVGNGLPKYHLGFAQTFDYKRFNVYGLLDGAFGQKMWNIGYAWSLGDLQSDVVDQNGKTVETARPIGYYWRRGPSTSPGGNAGVGGLYDALGPSTYNVEDASYMKLRELQINYHVGRVGGVGDWRVGVVGRNLHTWTSFRGFDPEAGNSTGALNSSALTPVAGYRFPSLRTFTVQLSSSF